MKHDVDSIMKEVEKIEEEFVSSAKTSQRKINKIISKLSKSIVNNAKKVEKDLTNEKKVIDSITSLVEKIEEVEKAIEIAKEVINDYSEGKNLSKEEQKK
jgi:superfamily II DNA/RNA helicase